MVERKKVCIVGFARTMRLVDFDLPNMEYWGFNELWRMSDAEKYDRWFDIHQDYTIREEGEEHIEFLKSLKIPLYMVENQYMSIKNAIEFPKKELDKKYNVPVISHKISDNKIEYMEKTRPYWTNSIVYMLLMAVEEGYKEIWIYGVDMQADDRCGEFIYQRPNLEYYIGLVRGMGIRVNIPEECDITKALYDYGYDDYRDFILAMRVKKYELERSYLETDEVNRPMVALLDHLKDLGCIKKRKIKEVEKIKWNLEKNYISKASAIDGAIEIIDYVTRKI
jgi:hypothetical protein